MKAAVALPRPKGQREPRYFGPRNAIGGNEFLLNAMWTVPGRFRERQFLHLSLVKTSLTSGFLRGWHEHMSPCSATSNRAAKTRQFNARTVFIRISEA